MIFRETLISRSFLRSRSAHVVLLLTLLTSPPGFGQEPVADQVGDFDLHEVVVLVSDPYRDNANAPELFFSTLPGFVRTKRPRAETDKRSQPMPIGAIRFHGEAPQGLDVLVSVAQGRFLGHWPRGKGGNKRLLWEDVQLTTDVVRLRLVPEEHWFNDLRAGTALYATVRTRTERSLLYDVELRYSAPVRVEIDGADGYRVHNESDFAVHDLEIYRPSKARWRVGHAAHVPPKKDTEAFGPPAPPVSQPTTDSQAASSPSSETQPAATQPAAEVAATLVTLGEHSTDDCFEALAGWKDRLADLGLTTAETNAALATLAEHALDPNWLTVLYRLDPAELDKLLPLEVVPQPPTIVRVGLVILVNADPAMPDRIQALIAQLGDRAWSTRQTAERELARLGQAALPHLKKVLNHSDLEIVFRAERLIEELSARETDK